MGTQSLNGNNIEGARWNIFCVEFRSNLGVKFTQIVQTFVPLPYCSVCSRRSYERQNIESFFGIDACRGCFLLYLCLLRQVPQTTLKYLRIEIFGVRHINRSYRIWPVRGFIYLSRLKAAACCHLIAIFLHCCKPVQAPFAILSGAFDTHLAILSV